MIQNTNDIYELIKSPLYAVSPSSTYHYYDIYNTSIPSDWMRVVFRDNYMEICKYKDRGSEYYENIITTSKDGQEIAKRFKKLLFAKRTVARMKMFSEKQR